MELLLRHGANPLLPNKYGDRPVDLVKDEQIRKMIQNEINSTTSSDDSSSSEGFKALFTGEKRSKASE